MRFGSMGVRTTLNVIAFMSIQGTIHRRGHFATAATYNNVLYVRLILIIAPIAFMTMAVMAEERERHEQADSNVNRRLIQAQEQERMWIARELHDDFNQRVAMLSLDLDGLERFLSGSDVHARRAAEIKTQLRELG